MKAVKFTTQAAMSLHKVQTQGSYWSIIYFVTEVERNKLMWYQLSPLLLIPYTTQHARSRPIIFLFHSGVRCRCCVWFLTSPVSSLLLTAATGWREFVLTTKVSTFQVTALKRSKNLWNAGRLSGLIFKTQTIPGTITCNTTPTRHLHIWPVSFETPPNPSTQDPGPYP